MIYRSMYFNEWNDVKILFEKNAEFNFWSKLDLPKFQGSRPKQNK